MTKIKNICLLLISCTLAIFGGFIKLNSVTASSINKLEVELLDKKVSGFVGEKIELPLVNPLYPQYVEKYTFTVYDSENNIQNIEGESFTPLKEGEYTVHLSILGNDDSSYIRTYKVNIDMSDAPIMVESPIIPVGLMDGVMYNTFEAKFIDFNENNTKYVDYEVSYIDDIGNIQVIEDTFIPNVSVSGNNIKLIYKAVSNITNKENVLKYEIPVLKVSTVNEWNENSYDYGKMFLTKGIDSYKITEKGTCFYGHNDFSLKFINKLDNNINVNLLTQKDLSNFTKINFVIEDAKNKKERATISFTQLSNTQSLLSINNNRGVIYEGSIIDEKKGLALSVDKDGIIYGFGDKVVSKIKKYENGKNFLGFNSGFVNLEIQVDGVKGNSCINIYDINGHHFDSDSTTDRIAPFCKTAKDIQSHAKLNEIVTVPLGMAIDVISPNIKAKVNVISPSYDVVTSIDGIKLDNIESLKDYEFKVEEYGEYTIQYSVEDRDGNVFDAMYYTVLVLDINAPTVKINESIKSYVSLNEEIIIPQLTMNDGEDGTPKDELVTLISVNVPHGNYKVVSSGDKFKFTEKGVYFIRFTVMDKYLNMTTITQKVICD